MASGLSRRRFLGAAGMLAARPSAFLRPSAGGVLVNDVHSQLNPTRVADIVSIDSVETLRRAIGRARREGRSVAIAGGRHAMGGQQFGTGAVLLDMRPLHRILGLDREKGIVAVEAGIQWPELMRHLREMQSGASPQWGIAQKQSGADALTLGGALAANIHGRGLAMKPFIGDIESFELIDAKGERHECSRSREPELFALAAGGYGLFGVVTSLRLRLVPRRKLERVVELRTAEELMPAFHQRVADGFLYGDFQFATDPASEDFLQRGVFSCYRPVDAGTPLTEGRKELSEEDWLDLLSLAHADKTAAFRKYAQYYLSTSGQVYWSDTQQLGIYLDDYHRNLDRRLPRRERGTEMITEIYVPRNALPEFLSSVRDDFRANAVELIYGTIRSIERDDESFLAWARAPYACVIFNLHVVHRPAGRRHAENAFRRLIDLAVERGGSYYLTYHRWASRKQVEACYPQFPEFLRRKRLHDPDDRFQSDWYRHYRRMFGTGP